MPRNEKEIIADLNKENLTLIEKQQLEKELEEERQRKEHQYQALLAIVLSYKAKLERFMEERRLDSPEQLILFPEIVKKDHTDKKLVEDFHKISKQVEAIFNEMEKIDQIFGPDNLDCVHNLKEEAPTVNKAFNEGTLKEDYKLSLREYSILAMSVIGKDKLSSDELAFSKNKVNRALELFSKGNPTALSEILSNGIKYQNDKLKYENKNEEISKRGEYLTELLAVMELHPEIKSNLSIDDNEILEAKRNMAKGFFINRELVATSCLMQAAMEGNELPPEMKEELLKDAALGMFFKKHGNEVLKNGDFSAVKLKQGIIPKELMAMINEMGDAKETKNYSELTAVDVDNILHKKGKDIESEKKTNEVNEEEIGQVVKKDPQKEESNKKTAEKPPIIKKDDAPVLSINNH